MVSAHPLPNRTLLPSHIENIPPSSERTRRQSTASTLAWSLCTPTPQSHTSSSASRSHSPSQMLTPPLPPHSFSQDSATPTVLSPSSIRHRHSQNSPVEPPPPTVSPSFSSHPQAPMVSVAQRKRPRLESLHFERAAPSSISTKQQASEAPYSQCSSTPSPSLPSSSTRLMNDRDRMPPTPPPSHRVVFVNPDDESQPWWWPAIVVPEEEFESFKSSVDNDVERPGFGELLVCYFEDASFNIVREADAAPFDPSSHPYTTFLNGSQGERFKKDKAVSMATACLQNGVVPRTFSWLRSKTISPPPSSKPKTVTFSDIKEEHPPPPLHDDDESSVPPSPTSREPVPKRPRSDTAKGVQMPKPSIKRSSPPVSTDASVPSKSDHGSRTQSRSPESQCADEAKAWSQCKKRRWITKRESTSPSVAPCSPVVSADQGVRSTVAVVPKDPVVEDEIEEGEVVENEMGSYVRPQSSKEMVGLRRIEVDGPITPPPS